MNNWHALKPVAFILLVLAAFLLVSRGVTEIITPSPENPAEGLLGALGAHREEGAWNLLGSDAQQQVTLDELHQLAEAVEQSPRKGILQTTAEGAHVEGNTGTASVKVKFGDLSEETVQIPVVQENGVWKVSSIAPVRALAEE